MAVSLLRRHREIDFDEKIVTEVEKGNDAEGGGREVPFSREYSIFAPRTLESVWCRTTEDSPRPLAL